MVDGAFGIQEHQSYCTKRHKQTPLIFFLFLFSNEYFCTVFRIVMSYAGSMSALLLTCPKLTAAC